jgi:hypothetical protein
MGGGPMAISTACLETNMMDEECINIYDFNYDTLTIEYGWKEGKHGQFKIKIIDINLLSLLF